MDKATELTDAYVEVRFGDYDVKRTSIARKTLNPVWQEDFRFEVSDDADLQNEPLELKVLDYDAISSNDVVGCVYIDLNPLLAWDVDSLQESTAVAAPATVDTSTVAAGNAQSGNTERMISGWFPLYDTLRGIRGEVNVQVKLQFFGDVNPFKDSSAGVQVYGCTALPPGYRIVEVFGFVEVLLNEDDPEYHWSDSFRAPRYSNESRQKLLYRLSGNLRRRLGREALEMGGNAIVGFQQSFDLENKEYSITARAIGTCVRLEARDFNVPVESPTNLGERTRTPNAGGYPIQLMDGTSAFASAFIPGAGNGEGGTAEILPMESSNAKPAHLSKQRPNTAPAPPQEEGAIYPPAMLNEDTLATSSRFGGTFVPLSLVRNNSTINSANNPYRSASEQHLITLRQFPEGVIAHLGGIVSARSVKLLQNDSSEVREAWWVELREEIKSHARALRCPIVIGYTETATIHDELCVLTAMGTAARLDFRFFLGSLNSPLVPPQPRQLVPEESGNAGLLALSARDSYRSLEQSPAIVDDNRASAPRVGSYVKDTASIAMYSTIDKQHRRLKYRQHPGCQACHIPYSRKQAPFPMSFIKCNCCKKRYVPEILITNIELLPELETVGEGYYVEAHICRAKKRKEGESNAATVSDSLPFIEYDLHRQLMYKLRIQGYTVYGLYCIYALPCMDSLNAIFGLQVQLTIGESLIIAVASGTATYLSALSPPPPLKITRNLEIIDAEDRQLLEIQRRIMERSEENRKRLEEARTLKSLTSAASSAADAVPPIVSSSFPEKGIIQSIIPEHPEPEPLKTQESTASVPWQPSASLESLGASPLQQSMSRTGSRFPVAAQIADGDSDSELSDTSEDGGVDAAQLVTSTVVQVDDDTDEDLMAVLLDPQFPDMFQICNTERLPTQPGVASPMIRLNNFLVNAKNGTVPDFPAGAVLNTQMITLVKEGRISTISHHPNRQLAAIFRELYEELQLSLGYYQCCLVTGIQHNIQLTDEHELHIRMNAMAIGQHISNDQTKKARNLASSSLETIERPAPEPTNANDFVPFEDQEDEFLTKLLATKLDVSAGGASPSNKVDVEEEAVRPSLVSRMSQILVGRRSKSKAFSGAPVDASTAVPSVRQSFSTVGIDILEGDVAKESVAAATSRRTSQPNVFESFGSSRSNNYVEITPLSHVPGSVIVNYLGHLSLHFVKEDLNLHHFYGNHYTESGYADAVLDDGIGTFIHRFTMEVQAIARAHTMAMGGNALISFQIQHSLFRETIKNQAYGLLSVSGDVVEVRYEDRNTPMVSGEEMVRQFWTHRETMHAVVNGPDRR